MLIQPHVAVTSETGTYRFPQLPIGTYSVKFELAGFKTVVREGIGVTIGFTRAGQRAARALDGAGDRDGHRREPDRRHQGHRQPRRPSTSRRCRTSRRRATRGSCSSARRASRWTAPTSAATSRASSPATSRAAPTTGNNKWSIDGVDITDMAATGASPIYYDFDMLEEMQVTTGGADASQQTGGVGINLVTKSGTDRFKGSGRALLTDDKFEADNITAGTEGAGRRLRRADPEHQGLRLRGRRPDHAAASCGTGAATARRTSRSASSASTRTRRNAVPPACR